VPPQRRVKPTETTDRQKLVLYLRVSNQEQVQGYSLDAQERAVTHYCLAHDGKYEIVATCTDAGVSAKSDDIQKRPGFQQAVEAVERGDADAIIVHKLDRFARNLVLAVTTLQRIDYRLICLDPPVDFTTATGRVHANIMMAFNQYYSDNLSEEVKKGLYERREQGLWLGHLPFGATRAADDDTGKQPPVPDRAAAKTDQHGQEWSRYDALQLIFRRAAEGRTLANICREVNDIGFDLSQSTVHYMLRNRFYLGELPVKGGDKNHVESWSPGMHMPLIDRHLFDAALATLQRNRRGAATVRSGARTYALTGVCTCGLCGSALHCDTVKGRARLHCYRRWKRSDCTQPTVKQAPVLAQIVVAVKAIRPPDSEIPALLQCVSGEPENLTGERQRMERKLQRLKDLYLNTDDLTLDDYERRKRDVERERALLEPVDDIAAVTQELLRYLTSFEDWWTDASDKERNEMLRHILTTVVVEGGAVTSLGLVPEADRLLTASVVLSSPAWDISNQPAFAAALPRSRGCGTDQGRRARGDRA